MDGVAFVVDVPEVVAGAVDATLKVEVVIGGCVSNPVRSLILPLANNLSNVLRWESNSTAAATCGSRLTPRSINILSGTYRANILWDISSFKSLRYLSKSCCMSRTIRACNCSTLFSEPL